MTRIQPSETPAGPSGILMRTRVLVDGRHTPDPTVSWRRITFKGVGQGHLES